MVCLLATYLRLGASSPTKTVASAICGDPAFVMRAARPSKMASRAGAPAMTTVEIGAPDITFIVLVPLSERVQS